MKYVITCLAVIFLVGCEEDPKVKNPVVYDVGTFNDCDVTYVDRGSDYRSFYMAKCGKTATTTQTYSSGKSSYRRTVIVDEAALDSEMKTLQAKKDALNKLSKEDRAALGLQ
jgi:hypothetical protein